MSTASDFQHVYLPGTSERTLLALHGTGGDERSLVPLARDLDPTANILSPRGKILEMGQPRFFRRLAEGVFDIEDLIRRTHDLADFIAASAEKYGFDPKKVFAIGYSNGANIAASLLLLRPEAIAGGALLRAMVPLVPDEMPNLAGKQILILSGEHDPIVEPENPRRLAALFTQSGASVDHQFEPVGHGLTQETFAEVKRWLAALA